MAKNFDTVGTQKAYKLLNAYTDKRCSKILQILDNSGEWLIPGKPMNVKSIQAALGVTQPETSIKLKILSNAKLVSKKRIGKEIFHARIEDNISTVRNCIAQLDNIHH